VQVEDISVVVPLLQFIPIFVLFMSFFFLQEVLDFFDYAGFVIIIAGGLIISTRSLKRIFRVERVFLLMLIAGIFYAISDVSIKYVFMKVEYWNAFIMFWFLHTLILLTLLFSPKIRKEAKLYIKKIGLKLKILIISVTTVSLIAHILGNFAIKLGPVTLVDAVVNIQLVFTFLLAIFLTNCFPGILKERMDRKATTQKVVGMTLIIIGVLLTQVL
jgi:drug/metabolite transporter (DMT)-like permease